MNEDIHETGGPGVPVIPNKKEKKKYSTPELIGKASEYLTEFYGAYATDVLVEEIIVDRRFSTTEVQLSFDLAGRLSRTADPNTETVNERIRKTFTLETRTGVFLSMRNE